MKLNLSMLLDTKTMNLVNLTWCVEECLGVPKVMPDIELTLSQEWVEL